MNNPSRSYLGDLESDASLMRVGAFELIERIGDGSMGEVWRGYHSQQDVEVALKVIVAEHAMKTSFQRAFRQEVRNVASLTHPFIVEVFDYGLIDVAAEHGSLGLFQAGSPFLVMEYAGYGALADAMNGPMEWESARLILFALLDGLAHSHARGVIHRDVKPQNVLLSEVGGQPQIKLTDFGLSYVLRGTQEVANWHKTAGTPEYMAPEQIKGLWRQYGPATDLYALGCVAYEMITGRCPFGGRNMVQIARAHLDDPVPVLEGGSDVPDGVERWIAGLLEKDPRRRFQSAADAAYALKRVGGKPNANTLQRVWQRLIARSESDVEGDERDSVEPFTTFTLEALWSEEDDHGSSGSSSNDGGAQETSGSRVGDEQVGLNRPIPRRGRKCRDFFRPRRLVGTGRELFEMRRLPFIGREEERDHLWARLLDCAETQRIGATLISGPAGVGKDRLAEWLCERVTELGVAQVIRAYHEASNEIVDGMARAVEREFALHGLDRAAVHDFFKEQMMEAGAENPYEWEAITEIVYSGDPDDEGSPRVHFEKPKQRHLAMARYLRRLSRQEPLVVWLNDVQWAAEALRFLKTIVDDETIQGAVYFVLTARDDLLADDEANHKYMKQILSSERSDAVELGPLPAKQLRRLVEESLFLEHSAVFEVVRRSGGNPLHAMELVREWIDQDLLQPRAKGFALVGDVPREPPGQWDELWDHVIDRLSEGRLEVRKALELGAILGERFSREVWGRAANELGIEVPEDMVERALEAKYLYSTPEGLVFAQNLLREALLASARQGGRWEQLCKACAIALDSEDRGQGNDERVGFLLLEAREILAGARRLWNALEARQKNRDYHNRAYLAERGQEALRELNDRSARQLRCQFLVECSNTWSILLYSDRAGARAMEAIEIATELGLDDTKLEAMFFRATTLYHQGEKGEARQLFEALLDELDTAEADQLSLKSRAHFMVADLSQSEGDVEEATNHIDQAVALARRADDPVLFCNIEFGRLKTKVIIKQDDCREELEALIERTRELRLVYGEAVTTNLRAELARLRGDLDDARKWYERAIANYEFLDRDRGFVPRLNLALISIERGDVVAGGEAARRIVEQQRRTRRPLVLFVGLAAMLPMLVVREAWDEISEVLEELEVGSEKAEFHLTYDHQICLLSALKELRERGDQERLEERLEALLAQFDEQ